LEIGDSFAFANESGAENDENGDGGDEDGKSLPSFHLLHDHDAENDDEEHRDLLDEIVDGVLQLHDETMGAEELHATYETQPFRLTPIGAKRNVFIDKQLTRAWMHKVRPRFYDESMMYYWLDYTTAMQMNDALCVRYNYASTNRLLCCLVNYELYDEQQRLLYGIIAYDDERVVALNNNQLNAPQTHHGNDRYVYKLTTLMTAAQIKSTYRIALRDLPSPSRRCPSFRKALRLRRYIARSDLAHVCWNKLRRYKSTANHNGDVDAQKSVAITPKVMRAYCRIALERVQQRPQQKRGRNRRRRRHSLIPVVVVDKQRSFVGVEWVLIVRIVHRNCDVGVSFRYEDKSDSYVATALFLDKAEIESKHRLVGLQHDYCQYIRPFSLKKFRFKRIIVDDDDDDDEFPALPHGYGHGHGQNTTTYHHHPQQQQQQQQQQQKRYISYQTRVVELLRKAFSIKGVFPNKRYHEFINNEMAQFLASDKSIHKFLDVSTKLVIGKCTEDLKHSDFDDETKDVIDEFGKLVVACVKHIDLDPKHKQPPKFVLLKAFFHCVHSDAMHRTTKKLVTLFNQRPYLRLIVFVLVELSDVTYASPSSYGHILWLFAQFLNDMRPQKCPHFTFSWVQLLSHSKFMPKILKHSDSSSAGAAPQESSSSSMLQRCKHMFHDLLMHLLQFMDPYWRSPQSSPSVCALFQGTLRILLVLLHDFPSFLCEYHFSFCQHIPISSFQMRNLVLSAFPKNTQLPDPFQPNLNLESIAEMEQHPRISSDYLANLVPHKKEILDAYLYENDDRRLSSLVASLRMAPPGETGSRGFVIQYDLPLMNSVVLYVASIGGDSREHECMELVHHFAVQLDDEGRYHLFNAVCNNLRYPNCHTKFCSAAILYMFKKSKVDIKEQITRILLERLVVHRPHPWGLLITFIMLIKNPEYRFWDEPFTRCASEIESLFRTVASSCFKVFK